MNIYQGNKIISPAKYAYDKESLIEFLKYCETNEKYFIGKKYALCGQQGNKWSLLPGDGIFHWLRPNDDYYVQGKINYTWQDLCDKIDEGKYILILMNKNGK